MSNTYIKDFLKDHGINDEAEADKVLNMTKADIPSGAEILNSATFNDEVINEIKAGHRITVFGDYDTDGAMATIVMVRSLQALSQAINGNNGHISYYINDRFVDGYGISQPAIDKLKAKNPKLDTIITVDNGIVAFDAVKYAKSLGLKVIITDHHKSLDELPDADVVVDPSQNGDDYPFKGISGTTVAYKLMLNLFNQHYPEHVKEIESLVDFVGVSVVSDIMPMKYENRVYVKEALDIFNGRSGNLRFGWYALKEYLLKIRKLQKNKEITEMNFGFLFSPIINAQSRVNGKANITVDMFLSTDTSDVREKAKYMVEVNEERKAISNNAFAELSKKDYSGKPIIIIRDDDLGEGLIGLIAGKITQAYNRPSIVLTQTDDGLLKGSARSIENVDITDNLRKLNQDGKYMPALGGHSGAGGMSMYADKLADFEKEAIKLFGSIIPADLAVEVNPDFKISADDLNIDFIQQFNSLAPFGAEFEFPLIEVDDLPVDEVKAMGKDKSHLKIKADGMDIINWSGVDKFKTIAENSEFVDVIGTPQVNSFMNRQSVQIITENDSLNFHN